MTKLPVVLLFLLPAAAPAAVPALDNGAAAPAAVPALDNGAAAQSHELALSLADAEKGALSTSDRLKAAEGDWRAAEEKAGAQKSRLYPRLALEGSYRHVTEVPDFSPVAGAPAIPFGDNENYSFGPSVSWTAWDFGSLQNAARSQRSLAASKRETYEAARRDVLQSARLAYFQAQLALERLWLLGDSLKLAQSQYEDIRLRQRAGAASRMDSLSAHQEVLKYRREFRQAQSDTAAALRELFAQTGAGAGADPSVPLDKRLAAASPKETDAPTMIVTLPSLDEARVRLTGAAAGNADPHHPAVESHEALAESARRSARGAAANQWPALQLYAKTSRDYPNGPVLESFHQNTVSLTASMPLVDWGRTRREAAEQKRTAAAHERRRDQALEDLRRAWDNAQDQLKGHKAQEAVNAQAVKESAELARLVYDDYRAGRSPFLEVENANLRALQAKTAQARNEVEILIQLAVLDSLSASGENQ